MAFIRWRRGRKKPPLLQRLYTNLVRHYFAKDLLTALQLEAQRESVAYVKQHMGQVVICNCRQELWRFAIDRVAIEGLYCEFGVKKAASLREIAAMTTYIVHGFDSFEGLPEDWAGTVLRKGRFSTRGVLPKVPANCRLHPGWFNKSLPPFVAEHGGSVAFMHIDCDLYSSTCTIFDHLGPRIVSGTVIVFDEYFNYPNWQQHEFKAFQEFVSRHAITYDYLAITALESTVAVQITRVGTSK